MKHVEEITIDLETVPSQEEWVKEYVSKTVKPPAQTKKQESIDKWYEEKYEGAVEEALSKCALDGAMNHIVCIGYAVNGEDPKVLYIEDHNKEAKMIQKFYDDVVSKLGQSPVVAGHNIIGFDLKVLRQRSMILGLELPKNINWKAKAWDDNPFDSMLQWDAKNFIKLEKLCHAFGVPTKDGLDGSMVYDLWKSKNYRDLVTYAANDVIMTRDLCIKMGGLSEKSITTKEKEAA